MRQRVKPWTRWRGGLLVPSQVGTGFVEAGSTQNVAGSGAFLAEIAASFNGSGNVGHAGTTITITGSSFGTKSTVAPHFHQPFIDTEEGDNYLAIGFDRTVTNGQGNHATANRCRMEADDGPFPGSGYFRQTVPEFTSIGEWFTHFSKDLPSGGVEGCYINYWYRVTRVSGSDSSFNQYKGPRVGCSTSTDPGQQYSGSPKYASQWSVSTLSSAGSNRYKTNPGAEYDSGSGLQQDQDFSKPAVGFIDGQWHNMITYYRLNAVGSSNGIQRIWAEGNEYFHITNRNIRSNNNQRFRFAQPNPGLANDYGNVGNAWTVDWARMHIDVVADSEEYCAVALLGNASSWSSVTKTMPLRVTSWSDTEIVASTDGLTIPEEFTHAYVETTSGSRNSTGLSFSVS